jgi:hypothetical protein
MSRLYVILIWSTLLVYITTGATIHVSRTGSHTSPYDTWAKASTNLLTAFNLATVGDTILVTNGTHLIANNDTITIFAKHSDVTFRSMNGPTSTIITRATGNQALFTTSVNPTNFYASGFTIADCTNSTTLFNGFGSTATISNMVFKNNVVNYSSGALIYGTKSMTDVIIVSNRVNSSGAATILALGFAGSPPVDTLTYRNVYIGYNYGLGLKLVTLTNSVRMSDMTIEYNANTNAGGYGGGISTDGASGIANHNQLILSNFVVRGNYAERGGGLYLSGSVPITIDRFTVISNSASAFAGGLWWYVSGSPVTGIIKNSVFLYNDTTNDQHSMFFGTTSGSTNALQMYNVTSYNVPTTNNKSFRNDGGFIANSIIWEPYTNYVAAQRGHQAYSVFQTGSTVTGGTTSNKYVSGGVFVDEGRGDFRVPLSSPAKGAGSAAYASAFDISGIARSVPYGIDAGAYSYFDSPFVLPYGDWKLFFDAVNKTFPRKNQAQVDKMNLNLATLPTNSVGLSSGVWYRDNDVLKVKE